MHGTTARAKQPHEPWLLRRAADMRLPSRWPGIWLNVSTDYVCTGNFLLKRHPFTIPFLDLWINSGDVVPELKPFHTWFSWEQRPLNALVRHLRSRRKLGVGFGAWTTARCIPEAHPLVCLATNALAGAGDRACFGVRVRCRLGSTVP